MTPHPLGDQAVMLYFEEEAAAFSLAQRARSAPWPWLIDVVQAYRSVAVFYDLAQTTFADAADSLRNLKTNDAQPRPARLHTIPCCYDLGLDLDRIARHTGLERDEIIARHSGAVYTVYAIGFCPGFPYLGYLPEELAGVPRLETPRLKVEAGSVGLTGRQTGIYTEERPGGWNILGRTPLELVNVADGYFPLRTGNQIRFHPISTTDYNRLKSTRMPNS